MRSKNIHSDGSGNGPDSDFINRVLERLKELQLYSTDTVKVEQTTRGTRFHAAAAGKGGSNANGHVRGEYISTEDYLTDDLVSVASGANAGLYACVSDHPPAAVPPWVGGGYWIKLAGYNSLGQWM